MLILTIRSDQPEAELGLFNDNKQLAYITWQADRQLAETIHLKIKTLLESQSLSLKELRGIVVFKGPGSFTGLRIGLSVTNALAVSLGVPIVAETGDDWSDKGLDRLKKGDNDHLTLPEYGAPPHITQAKK